MMKIIYVANLEFTKSPPLSGMKGENERGDSPLLVQELNKYAFFCVGQGGDCSYHWTLCYKPNRANS